MAPTLPKTDKDKYGCFNRADFKDSYTAILQGISVVIQDRSTRDCRFSVDNFDIRCKGCPRNQHHLAQQLELDL